MSLTDQINHKRKEIHTDAYPMSIGELVNLYIDDDLDIHPEFQRIYRWTEVQKSRLIESILLGIPLPSFFVAQRDDGVWDVVDGLQRLSTIFSFLGIYKNEKGNVEDHLVLKGTEYLPALEGLSWSEDFDEVNFLSKDLQRTFKREKVDIKIIKKESDDQTKYELFQRLNTYGSSLSDQEVRNCLLIMIDKSFYFWIKELSDYPEFMQTLTLTDKQRDEQYHMELVSRFLILTSIDKDDLRKISDIGEFITKQIKIFASNPNFDRKAASDKFRKTFEMLSAALGDNSFRKFQNGKYTGGFSLSIFEVIALGLGYCIDEYSIYNKDDISKLVGISEDLNNKEEYVSKSGSGYKAASRLPHILPFGRRIFKK